MAQLQHTNAVVWALRWQSLPNLRTRFSQRSRNKCLLRTRSSASMTCLVHGVNSFMRHIRFFRQCGACINTFSTDSWDTPLRTLMFSSSLWSIWSIRTKRNLVHHLLSLCCYSAPRPPKILLRRFCSSWTMLVFTKTIFQNNEQLQQSPRVHYNEI